MKNILNKIYLQVGDECPDDADFEELEDVSWNKDKVFSNDIEYVKSEKAIEAFKGIITIAVSASIHNDKKIIEVVNDLVGVYSELLNL